MITFLPEHMPKGQARDMVVQILAQAEAGMIQAEAAYVCAFANLEESRAQLEAMRKHFAPLLEGDQDA